MSERTIYLAGPITGDPNYKEKFAAAEAALSAEGYIVLNPAILPYPAFTHEQYMQIGIAMLDACAAACFLPGWECSPGARREYESAEAGGKRIFCFSEWKASGGCTACRCSTCRNTECITGCTGCDDLPLANKVRPKEKLQCRGYRE